jgi:uncharacterized protein YgiB involved in biofilm formation
MKRSRHLRLSLMTVAVPAVLAGCDSPDTGTVLQSVEQCGARTDLNISQAECRLAYDAALADHLAVAPRFESSAQCNAQFGNCEPVQHYGMTYFIPPMAGFLVGYLANRRGDDGYAYGYGGSVPLYRERRGDYYTPRGDYVSDRVGNVRTKSVSTSPPARALTISRSGFGSSSAARSSFGGRGG